MTDTAAPTPAPAAKKSSLGRIIKRLILLAVVLVIVLVVVLFLSLNTLVRMGVTRGGAYATGQNTDLESANLSFGQGTLQLSSMAIDNLKGYTAPKLITMKGCDVIVQSSSVLTHTVKIDEIAINGLEIWLEQNGAKNNLSEIIDQIQKNTAAAGGAPSSGSGGASSASSPNTPPGKELKIGKLSITGTKVHVILMGQKLDLDLPPLTIEDPTNPDGRPMKIADLVGTILLHLSQQIVENPQIPGGIKDGMKNVTAIVGNLKDQLGKGVKQFGNVGNVLQNATKGIDPGKGMPDIGKNIGDLLNPKKDPPK